MLVLCKTWEDISSYSLLIFTVFLNPIFIQLNLPYNFIHVYVLLLCPTKLLYFKEMRPLTPNFIGRYSVQSSVPQTSA